MFNRTGITLAIITLATAGCAHRPVNPDAVRVSGGLIIDGKGMDRNLIVTDGNECAGIAQEANPEGRAVAGAVAGAVMGALLGALIYRGSGLSGNSGATYGAGAGALGGVSGGAAAGAQDFRTVVRNCMIQRGHRVLN